MPQVVDNKTNVSNENHEKYMGRSHKSGLLDVRRNPIITWNQKVQNTELEKFQNLIEKKYKKCFDVIESIRNFVIVNTCTSASYGQLSRASYWDFHKWSIENYVTFWEEIWHFFHVICSKSYDKVFVKTGPGFLDNEWFSGARFNFAENILRYRDDRIALMYIDVSGNEESVTFAGMFEEVKLYAAAFRKNGLKKGDVVACYMSHRKEAIYTMLAATSIGAIFGGPSPFLGGKYVSNIVNMMDAKFLITIDYHEDAYLDEMIQMKMLKHIPIIPDKCPTLEKVILLVTQKETYAKDLSNIRNCVFLEDFLKDGRNPDGTVPDIIFEQLPFSHPICINFTSGTTGLPKAPIHSAGTLISHFRDLGIHLNLKTGDTVAQMYSVGWAVWDYFIPTLALGIKYFLYCSSVFCKFNGKTFWDMMAKYNVKFTLMATSCVEYMEKMGIEPSPGTNLDCLEIVGVGSSPVKKESFEYLQNRVKKDLFIVSLYGATEVFGAFAGCNLNMPVYAGEIQTFSLATDVKCFDEAGKSVIGKKGELVVCTPSPAFPTGLWKDENNIRLHEAYLSKYEGVWCQNDYCWINPKTKGLIVIGRSDDTIIQNDERFSAGVIYFAIHSLKELEDYICVGQRRDNGDSRAILFVKMQKAYTLMPEMKSKIEKCIEKELNVDFIPECIVEVPEIPYNINNKRMESVVRKIVAKNEIPEVMNIKNPESLKHFLNIPEVMCYNEI